MFAKLPKTKKCSKCKKRFKRTLFNKNGNGVSSYCKRCTKIYSRNYWKDVRALSRACEQYDITESKYASLLKRQHKVCAICECPDARRNLSIDHDHITGQVRGLLCTRCNLVLGLVKDSASLLRTAIKYLKGNNDRA